MKKLKFKCTLLSDVILNARAATTGPNETLDFIPGSNFLGIVASSLYDDKTLSADTKTTIFHSGKVRFGDAHPSKDGIRGLKVPASMYYPKLSKPENELYIHHLIPKEKDMSGMQLKQCRSGFYVFPRFTDASGKTKGAEKVATFTDFAIKSAYDRKQRRSKDEQLFGYQSLRKGLTMYFSVEMDDTTAGLSEKVTEALKNGNRIGRSRSAQYGLVRIEPADYLEEDGGRPLEGELSRFVAVYADSRLIFLDKYGQLTFQPTAAQLGLEGEIDWEKSQVRTFRYAPWNFKRQCFDTDRCGIEKGSVIVVKLQEGSSPDLRARALGSYVNEGFGHVIYNPSFLRADSDGNALCRLREPSKSTDGSSISRISTPLISFLKTKEAEHTQEDLVVEMVNSWVTNNTSKFSKREYSSQWGAIRSLATSASSLGELKEDLFGDDNAPTGYLVHGVAMEKWVGPRLNSLKKFIDALIDDRSISDAMGRMAVVNLAAEMAKKCK